MPDVYAGADVFPTDYEIPADGDARDAASVNTALSALGDRTYWLQNRTPVAVYGFGGVTYTSLESFTTNVFVKATDAAAYVLIPDCEEGDWLEVYVTCAGMLTDPAGDRGLFCLMHRDDHGGGSATDVTFPRTLAVIPILGSDTVPTNVSMYGWDEITEDGDCRVIIAGACQDGGGGAPAGSVALMGWITGHVKHFKKAPPTVVP